MWGSDISELDATSDVNDQVRLITNTPVDEKYLSLLKISTEETTRIYKKLMAAKELRRQMPETKKTRGFRRNGLFGKSKHEKQVEGLARVMVNLYLMTTEGRHGAPVVLSFQRRDAHYRHLMFCLSTAHVACAHVMGNADAVLNDVLQRAVVFAMTGSRRSSVVRCGHSRR